MLAWLKCSRWFTLQPRKPLVFGKLAGLGLGEFIESRLAGNRLSRDRPKRGSVTNKLKSLTKLLSEQFC